MTGAQGGPKSDSDERDDHTTRERGHCTRAAGCGSLALPPVSPLAGTWYFVTRNPGLTYAGPIEFDDAGQPVRMQIIAPEATQYLVFDGKSYEGDDGDYETDTATATLTGDELVLDARVRNSGGEYKGVTYITLEATVHDGQMSGCLRIVAPDGDGTVFDVDATRQ